MRLGVAEILIGKVIRAQMLEHNAGISQQRRQPGRFGREEVLIAPIVLGGQLGVDPQEASQLLCREPGQFEGMAAGFFQKMGLTLERDLLPGLSGHGLGTR